MTQQQKSNLTKMFTSLHKPTIKLINKRIEKQFELIKNQLGKGLSLDAVLDGNMILQREGIKSYFDMYLTYLLENVIDFIEEIENDDSDDDDDSDEDDDDDYSDDDSDDEDDSNTITESNE